METVNKRELRALLLLLAVMYGLYLAYAAITELMKQSQRAEVATIRADLAAWQVSGLLQEAREITLRAAQERGLRGDDA